MKSHTTEFADFLNQTQQFIIADLYTITVSVPAWDTETYTGGLAFLDATYYYTSFDRTVEYEGNTYVSTGPILERGRVRSMVGMEVDVLSMRVYASETMLIEGQPFLQACIKGTLDGATLSLDRLYMNSDLVPQGVVNMFTGRIAPVKASRSMAEIEVRSKLELLNINMPRNLYQPGCQHTLYDAGCAANRLSFDSSSTAASGSTTTKIIPGSAMGSKPSGYWDLGGLIFTSGLNTNVLRTIRSWDGTDLELVSPLPFAPSVGDTFALWAGCDKTMSTCQNKFNNLVHFKGFPFVPQPETMR